MKIITQPYGNTVKPHNMEANNFNVLSKTLFGAYGIIRHIGEYAGEYEQEAFDLLEVEGDDFLWADIMYSEDSGKIVAVASNVEGDMTGDFFFKEIFDGTAGDGEILESISKELARYNVYYHGTDSVDYSVRFLELPNGMRLVYPTRENVAYISSEEELDEAREDDEQYNEEDGYWS